MHASNIALASLPSKVPKERSEVPSVLSCVESQGCHLIPFSYLLSCSCNRFLLLTEGVFLVVVRVFGFSLSPPSPSPVLYRS